MRKFDGTDLFELLLQNELVGRDELLVKQHTGVAAEHELAHLLPQLLDVLRRELGGGAEEDAWDLERARVDLCDEALVPLARREGRRAYAAAGSPAGRSAACGLTG